MFEHVVSSCFRCTAFWVWDLTDQYWATAARLEHVAPLPAGLSGSEELMLPCGPRDPCQVLLPWRTSSTQTEGWRKPSSNKQFLPGVSSRPEAALLAMLATKRSIHCIQSFSTLSTDTNRVPWRNPGVTQTNSGGYKLPRPNSKV